MLVNVFAFLTITHFSEVTYLMGGHMKTVLLLTVGYIARTSISLLHACGLALAGVGIALYTHFKLAEKKRQE